MDLASCARPASDATQHACLRQLLPASNNCGGANSFVEPLEQLVVGVSASTKLCNAVLVYHPARHGCRKMIHRGKCAQPDSNSSRIHQTESTAQHHPANATYCATSNIPHLTCWIGSNRSRENKGAYRVTQKHNRQTNLPASSCTAGCDQDAHLTCTRACSRTSRLRATASASLRAARSICSSAARSMSFCSSTLFSARITSTLCSSAAYLPPHPSPPPTRRTSKPSSGSCKVGLDDGTRGLGKWGTTAAKSQPRDAQSSGDCKEVCEGWVWISGKV